MLGHGATGQFAIGQFGAGATAETITVDKWYERLGEPVRFPPSLLAGAQQFTAFNPLPRVSFAWFNGLSEPPRFKPALPAGEQQFAAFNPQPFVSFGWFAELSKPSVLTKPGLSPALQQFFTTDTAVIPTSKLIEWFQALSTPVRFPAAVPAGEHQFTALNPLPRVSFAWFDGLSEPPRFKPGLSAALQDFFAIDTAVIPTSKLIEWFQGLSTPVRFPPMLLEALQQAFAAPSQLRPNPTTTAVLKALETKDTMLAGVVEFNRVVSGEIGVIEASFTGAQIGMSKVPAITSGRISISVISS